MESEDFKNVFLTVLTERIVTHDLRWFRAATSVPVRVVWTNSNSSISDARSVAPRSRWCCVCSDSQTFHKLLNC